MQYHKERIIRNFNPKAGLLFMVEYLRDWDTYYTAWHDAPVSEAFYLPLFFQYKIGKATYKLLSFGALSAVDYSFSGLAPAELVASEVSDTAQLPRFNVFPVGAVKDPRTGAVMVSTSEFLCWDSIGDVFSSGTGEFTALALLQGTESVFGLPQYIVRQVADPTNIIFARSPNKSFWYASNNDLGLLTQLDDLGQTGETFYPLGCV
jgi:hypothetical protein